MQLLMAAAVDSPARKAAQRIFNRIRNCKAKDLQRHLIPPVASVNGGIFYGFSSIRKTQSSNPGRHNFKVPTAILPRYLVARVIREAGSGSNAEKSPSMRQERG